MSSPAGRAPRWRPTSADPRSSTAAASGAGGGGGAVDSVNGQTGTVLLGLGDLDDVSLGAVSNGDVLSYDGSDWVSSAAPPADISGSSISQLNDVTISSASTGDVLRYNGSAWVDAQLSYNDLADQPSIPSEAPVDSVAGKTGDVTLAKADIVDFSDGDYATAAQGTAADSAIQPGVVNPVYFANQAAFPDATANHGAVAHSHADGAMYFAHGGTWSELANASDVPSVDPNTVITNSVPTFTVTVETTERTITAGAFDLATGNHWTCGAITVPAPTNAATGTSGLIRITAGPVTWNTVFKFPGGAAPTIASFPAVIPFYVQDTSNILMGNVAEGIA